MNGKVFGTVVDVGAGSSPYRKFIVCDRYVYLDIENRTGRPEIIISDLNQKIMLKDGFADCVVCTEVLEHIKKPQNAVNEVYRILKPGGMLVLTTPMVWPLHEAPNDFYRYTQYGLEGLLKEAGFSDISIRPSNGYIYSLIQLSVINLRNPFWKPLVLVFNICAILFERYDRNFEMSIVNQVVAIK
ncbi:MAG: hypothetical protein A2568_03565 [Candidatus Yanofskybacteria bacterium RIFOXYD1_FULL_44_17]|nr:MAG: hypothetical protein A2207_03145 [Candidatus Yanofskybacteria bacterium RIFOXYA1_FULL_44_17]OGN36370.1 MAG: hypothetical protein A2241_01340 [Candidatus Yanofskybacteria bacterium RIFOXYA2_FULL_45_28]OGN37578.1 MAG: hypothetical protein A2302_03770 [Candidatus Yanofskybacteria bacterium RIFOXYB2_FULL_44_18]OGN37963.1 MAG: hypothetical protein A2405_00520 [Candidatus Yanofskybacteria bacterium RIFOXYC1_FULL_44_16]OGN39650.1 MAG: hypothetical protein A2568_03565 [Candidatus Yanofskybacter